LAGIIIAAVVGTIIILVIAILLYKRRQKKRATADKQQEEEGEGDGIGHDEKDIEIGGGPIVPGEMAYTSQPANLHSDRPGASIPEQPKVVGPEADRAVVDSNK
jgi:flagellar biosynthesis/type III secretory pathway M-ring protein FliF/YscJ